MPKLDLDRFDLVNVTGYPPPLNESVAGRWYRRLGPLSGLTDFGVSHVTLQPGAWSSQRHWHEEEDELVVILSGEAVLVDDHGRHPMRAGDIAAFPKGDANGHVLINESDADCVMVAVGRLARGVCHYPDVDLHKPEGMVFTRKDGSPI